jgi:hypothetical protein
MALYRCESVLDHATGRYFLELYYPETSTTPVATSAPVYASHDEAEADTLRMFARQLAAIKGDDA